MKASLAAAIAAAVQAYKHCITSKNPCADNWLNRINYYNSLLPYGLGSDTGCEVDIENSTLTKLIIKARSYSADGKRNNNKLVIHTVKVIPMFDGIMEIDATNDRDGTVSAVFHASLTKLVEC